MEKLHGALEFQGIRMDVEQIQVNGMSLVIPTMDKDGYYTESAIDIPYANTMGDRREQQIQRCLLDYMKPDYTFVDIGANIGFYSALMQDRCKMVHAFEPNPMWFYLLVQNTSRKNVNCYCHGLAHKNGVGYSVGYSQIWSEPDENFDNYQVLVAKLDRHNIDADIIKVDVEGMADMVIAGGLRTFAKADVVLIELHEGEDAHTPLKSLGFHIKNISEKHLIAVKPHIELP